ncbi:MAG: lactoylglutathione lyase, partial [Bradymonadia bacterium]
MTRSTATYLHAMVRVLDVDAAVRFFCEGLGLIETRRRDSQTGRFTLVYLKAPGGPDVEIELTHNWDETERYDGGRNFGHLAFGVDDIYQTCAHLQSMGVQILRPPRDGRMAFVRTPDAISIELLQTGGA